MPKEKRCLPFNCDSIISDINTRLDHLYRRHATLVSRMDEFERSTRERLDQFSTQVAPKLEDMAKQQQVLLLMAQEQEEESTRIFSNQNDLLVSLQGTLNDIHEKLKQLAERQEATLRRVALSCDSE